MVDEKTLDDTPHFETDSGDAAVDATSSPGGDAPARHPERIARFRIDKVLGRGGFGLVYLAYDEQLDRAVAVKVPHAKLISRPEDAQAYLAEARTVANLDHPNIVPVFEVGSTDEFPCFIVSKYIEGTDLSSKIKQQRLSHADAAELTATIADALHYAHKQGLVHRDVKPGNILIGNDGRPYVLDFGLALREENVGQGPNYAGTPAYMSPEQARGEGHRVDGRSDIFSLGVVHYELLVGRQPFRADTREKLFEKVTSYEPRPLRQYDETIPKDLARICNKAMAKRVRERYSSAHDMAEELRHFLAEASVTVATPPSSSKNTMDPSVPSVAVADPPGADVSTDTSAAESTTKSSSKSFWEASPVSIVPKGLRSFDAHDSDFFLELLPGARDRAGLPEAIRFWKRQVEQRDADETFSVGLIYGPSGCGKSSFLKAGLLPKLDPGITPVYVEATASDTETRLLHGLRKRFTSLNQRLDLKQTLAALRRGLGMREDEKLLIVIDQIEQWLHAGDPGEHPELVQALRQCDGGRVQCIVLVRDDFWMAATRFMRELEVPLVEAHNSTGVDLFPLRHAKKVLAAFGRAFGALPANPDDIGEDQKAFLDQATMGLARDGLVICVRLALFAEMMKSKAWTTESLHEVGGAKGVGSTFLEETFSASSAPPKHRYHQKAARAVLKGLLPETGTEIKGNMRSRLELLKISGYEDRPRDFDELITILDRETRLITPTDPEGREDVDSVSQNSPSDQYFQLTHDYLVPSLRFWLTRKQQETRRGRAELRLAGRASLWSLTREKRHLPSLFEWIRIRTFVDRADWTATQQEMMRQAGRVHGLRGSLVLLALLLAAVGGLWVRARQLGQYRSAQASSLIKALTTAEITQVADIIRQLQPLRNVGDAQLANRLTTAADGTPEKLNLSLALLATDPDQAAYLVRQIPRVSPEQFEVVRDSLAPNKTIAEALWKVAGDDRRRPSERFQAFAALAGFAADDTRWKEAGPFVAGYLTETVPSLYFAGWLEQIRSAGGALKEPLINILNDPARSTPRQQQRAAVVLAEYLDDRPDELVEVLLLTTDHDQFSPLLQSLQRHREKAVKRLVAIIDDPSPTDLSDAAQDAFWNRQAMASVTLLHLDSTNLVWPLLRHSRNPSLRSSVVQHARRFRADPATIAAILKQESDVTIRRALVQILGGTYRASLMPAQRDAIATQLKDLFRTDPDPGIHGAALWALRQWDITPPELPAGPTPLDAERARRLGRWDLEIQSILRDMEATRQNLPERRAAWEKQLSDGESARAESLPSEVAKFLFDGPDRPARNNASDTSTADGDPTRPDLRTGVVGNAAFLNGQDGVECDTEFSPEYTDAFSYGCWFQTDVGSQFRAILSRLDVGNRERGFDLWLEHGKLAAHLSHAYPESRIKVVAVEKLATSSWHHIFATYNGCGKASGLRLFVDGQQVDTTVSDDHLTGSIRTEAPFLVGKRYREGSSEEIYPVIGLIDEVRLFDRQLSGAEVNSLYQTVIAAVAHKPRENRSPRQDALMERAYLQHVLQPMESDLTIARDARRSARWQELPRWYTTKFGQTMIVIANTCLSDAEPLEHVFAIGAHEVSIEQYRRFHPEAVVDPAAAATSGCPIHLVSWWDAAAYCNWLSEEQGIDEDQWCYVPNAKGEYDEGMLLKPNFEELTGYRLPTATEWHYACKADTVTPFCSGDSINIATDYGWFGLNSAGRTHEIGALLPNDFGAFDMHGNLWEWILDERKLAAENELGRVLLGGDFGSTSNSASSTGNSTGPPGYTSNRYGFRVARTIK